MNKLVETRPTSIDQPAFSSPQTTELEFARLQEVSQVDLIGFDGEVQKLCDYNYSQDLDHLVALLDTVLVRIQQVGRFTQVEALATLRDVGMVAASIRRLDIAPTSVSSRLEPILLQLGKIGDSVPRETVYSYSLWNPRGPRQRSFTGSQEEDIFIESVRTWMEELEASRRILTTFVTETSSSIKSESMAHELSVHFDTMVKQMVEVRRKLPTATFNTLLQPYYYPFEVGGTSYEAPSGAHMNLLLIDQMLWGRTMNEPGYTRFVAHNEMYLPPMYRQFLKNSQSSGTLIGNLRQGIDAGQIDVHQLTVQNTLKVLLEVLHKIVSMRRIHFTLAREQDSIKVGEGNESKITGDDILSILLRETAKTRDQLKAYVS
jgi:hypothetical protein